MTKEFSDHGLEKFVTAKQRDACKDGFDLEDTADAIFLDLPNPWLAVPHAVRALKKSGIHSFNFNSVCHYFCVYIIYCFKGGDYAPFLHALSRHKKHPTVC